jgi:large subunit ribosomal protein L4
MEAKLYNQEGYHIGVIRLNDYVFGIEPNTSVMHQAMVRQLANARAGTHNTLGRSAVRGSTRKLYRQKGTGRARQGSARAPHRRGGGIAHGPHPRSYEKKMPRKMRRLAVRSALSAKQAIERIRFVDVLEFDYPRTRDMINMLNTHGLDGKTLIVLEEKKENVRRSANNLPYVKTLLASYLNVVDLLSYDNVILPVQAISIIEGFLGDGDESHIEIYPEDKWVQVFVPAQEPAVVEQDEDLDEFEDEDEDEDLDEFEDEDEDLDEFEDEDDEEEAEPEPPASKRNRGAADANEEA